jgi:hypothetical protein
VDEQLNEKKNLKRMTAVETQTWKLSEQTSKNNLVFASNEVPSTKTFSPHEMHLVLVFDSEEHAADLLYQDVKMLMFEKSLQDAPTSRKLETTVVPKHKNKNLFEIPFWVGHWGGQGLFISKEKPLMPVFTFPRGKPTGIVGTHLLVTGATGAVNGTECEAQHIYHGSGQVVELAVKK